jgi:hypothetical protein
MLLLFFGVLPREFLNFCGGRYFLVLPEYGNLFCRLYLLNFPTNKIHKVLIQGNVGATDHG